MMDPGNYPVKRKQDKSFVALDDDETAFAVPFPDRIRFLHGTRIPEDRPAKNERFKTDPFQEFRHLSRRIEGRIPVMDGFAFPFVVRLPERATRSIGVYLRSIRSAGSRGCESSEEGAWIFQISPKNG
jgi:hypothetical protein